MNPNDDALKLKETHLKYLPEVDGLRAVAVLSVLIFHAFPNVFPNGFQGVDLFFVISGYLISSIIFKGLDQGTFSILDFYQKRILRIFPALLTVLSFVLIIGALALISSELKPLGKHLIGAATFSSNFFLQFEQGYFDAASETKPLLHLWSLAIEEQFYLIYPFLLMFFFRRSRALLISLMFLISFAFNIGLKTWVPDWLFYFPISRFWELMFGAIIALSPQTFRNLPKRLNSGLSVLGSLLIGMGFLFTPKAALFPGYWAILPCAGAALIITSGSDSIINRILRTKPMVGIGKLSYPLYLWHWPLLSFPTIFEGLMPNVYFRILLLVLSLILSWLTVRWIENPIRFGKGSKSKKTRNLLIALMGIGALGVIIYQNKGFPNRDASIQSTLLEGDTDHVFFHQYLERVYYPCTPSHLFHSTQKYEGIPRCFQSKPNTQPEIVIIGDSHAEHLFIGLAELYSEKNVVYYLRLSAPDLEQKEHQELIEILGENKNIKTIILSMYWRVKEVKAQALERYLFRLKEIVNNIILFKDVPDFSFFPSRCKTRRKFRSFVGCEKSLTQYFNENQNVNQIFDQLATKVPNLKVVSVDPYFCNTSTCSMSQGSHILYRDNHHLNVIGSQYLGRKLMEDKVLED